MLQQFTNNAASTLAANIGGAALSLTVATGDGALFPALTGGQFFLATLCKVSSGIEYQFEIVKVTARAGDIFTIVRAQEGTTAQSYVIADRVSLRVTAALVNALALDADLTTGLATKQDTLASGTNIKTINGNPLTGSGDMVISSGGGAASAIYLSQTFGGI